MRIGKLCGNGDEIWFKLQNRYDLTVARAAMADEIAKIPTLCEAA